MFIHQLMNIWVVSTLGSFAIMNSAAMNIHVPVFVWPFLKILVGIYLGVELLDHMATLYLTV